VTAANAPGEEAQAAAGDGSGYRQIRLEIDGPVATVTLDRPDKLNAFTLTMMRELVDAFDRTDADDAVRAVIVTGAGDRAFCAGADLTPDKGPIFASEAEVSDLSDERVRDPGGLVTLRMFESRKPLIGAINGAAIGIGATMSLPMDFRLAATTARFGFVFTRRGITPEAASGWFLPRIVGTANALDWTLTGRIFPAEEAHRAGLVRSLHAPDDLLPAARALADEIAANTAPVATALTRAMMWRLPAAGHPMAAHRIDSRAVYTLSKSADAEEGVASFLAKRPPAFPGRVSRDMPVFYPWWESPCWNERARPVRPADPRPNTASGDSQERADEG
jgi:enoyl-CoA hydratase/carnithine racemase